jgi:integrase
LAQVWLDGRKHMASNYDERNRWKNHLGPALGHLAPDQVTVPVLKRLIIDLREKGLSKGTVGLQIALLSSFYGDLVEDGSAAVNPVRMLSRKTRKNELTSDWDPKKAPFIHTMDDVRRVWKAVDAVDRMVARAFIIGALAGLRTSEVCALRWEHVDFERMVIHAKEQVARRGPGVSDLKDGESRIVPMSFSLAVVIQPDKRLNGLVCSEDDRFLDQHRMGRVLSGIMAALEMPEMRWYEATRHTFGSQWVLNGGSLETLREMMGHSSVTVTERYAHLMPDNYSETDRTRMAFDSKPAPAELVN